MKNANESERNRIFSSKEFEQIFTCNTKLSN